MAYMNNNKVSFVYVEPGSELNQNLLTNSDLADPVVRDYSSPYKVKSGQGNILAKGWVGFDWNPIKYEVDLVNLTDVNGISNKGLEFSYLKPDGVQSYDRYILCPLLDTIDKSVWEVSGDKSIATLKSGMYLFYVDVESNITGAHFKFGEFSIEIPKNVAQQGWHKVYLPFEVLEDVKFKLTKGETTIFCKDIGVVLPGVIPEGKTASICLANISLVKVL